MTQSTPNRPWGRWYGLQRWRNRASLQMKLQPVCQMCLKIKKNTPAEIADHIEPHNGNQMLFWYGELQSLCKQHHSNQKAKIDRGVDVLDYDITIKDYSSNIGYDGWPIDVLHPVYRK